MADIALEVRGLTRRFARRIAVNELDLTVEVGDVYGFLGPNGAGKTTAMRCMLGLIRKHGGTVKVFGDTNMVRARKDVGAIIETPTFHPWMSGRKNLRQACLYAGLSGSAANKEMDRVLERVGLTDRAKDRAGTYSMGMKQRLGIARALLDNPKILFLDEPTNGLDPRGMAELRDFIRSLALHDGLTVFISSHMLAEVQAICNRVGIIQQGKLKAQGVVAELLSGDVDNVVEFRSPTPEAIAIWAETQQGVRLLGNGEAGRTRLHLGDMSVADANAALVHAGVPIDEIASARRSLEDVFLEVTT